VEQRARPAGGTALSTAAVSLALSVSATFAPAAVGRAADCVVGRAALHSMLASEYAFGEKARSSIPEAFLEYLAEDSWVLHPGPQPARPIYQAARDKQATKDNKDTLQWYPAVGDIASSGDLGFTSGPWVYTVADKGTLLHGHFLTVWKRDAECRWQVAFDGGISHAAPMSAEPKLRPDLAMFDHFELPPTKFVSDDAAGRAVQDFQVTAGQNGLAAALRTYARNDDFVFFTEGQNPFDGVRAASSYLEGHAAEAVHAAEGGWREVTHGRSADSTLLYSVGTLADADQHAADAYVEIWQYDPKVKNWGLRVLLVNPLPKPKEKS
jgi:ketosteroid isomerase-like protein